MASISESHISSYTRIVLSNFPILSELLASHVEWIKDKSQRDTSTPLGAPSILTEQQIRDALEGPYQEFFKNKIAAYAMIARIQTLLTMRQEEGFKEDFEKGEPTLWNPPAKALAAITINDLSNIRGQLDTLTQQHMQQWDGWVTEVREHLLNRLQEMKFLLSEIEVKEFFDEEPITELLNRYTDLNLTPPIIKKNEVDFQAYFTFKLFLTLHSALSRQHKPHGPDDIDSFLKKFKADFKKINKEQNALLKNQASETESVITPIAFARITPTKK